MLFDAKPIRLSMTAVELARAAGELLTGGRRMARAIVQRNSTKWRLEFLAHRFEFCDEPFNGQEYRATDDFLLLTGPQDTLDNPVQLVDAARLRLGQSLLMLCLGIGADHGNWKGAVAFQNELVAIDEIHIVGPRMSIIERTTREPT